MNTSHTENFVPHARDSAPEPPHLLREALRDWVVAVGKRICREELRDDTPLLEKRIITSLQVMDLILFIEALTGKAVDVERLKPGLFKDIDTISRNFLDT